MRIHLLAALAILTSSAAPAPAHAGFPVRVKMRCPVGGEQFTHTTTASMSTWGERPDGKPYGSWTFPLALPECPTNGLIVFREEFSRAEKATLQRLIADPAYRALRSSDTPYYRAHWLEGRLNPGSVDATWLLLRAVWEAEEGSDRRARYLREFAQQAEAAPSSTEYWTMLQLRAVNAHRELGEFDAARARLATLPTPPAPPAAVAGESEEAAWAREEAAEQAQAMAAYRTGLQVLIDRGDASIAPLDMLPEREVAERCVDLGDRIAESDLAQRVCTTEAVAAEMEEIRSIRAEMAAAGG
ncbi:MAG: hypothetical protein Q7U72_05690 [Brevundimonas sp.]|uniref:hypothetical protein n=1 Tax=Brevundimonas sp. TaxID=1871086 RepID=UPI0027251F75|nr:hypothetical protein [Brevundimonas sp.]MDO9076930.1 hypothetical protein [Brevundimonas sp.]MDP3080741.1 hypothetical protein [Brevundimonas sp.]MDZ4109351.1 hypothetical protein [Brevundimonas sp.]